MGKGWITVEPRVPLGGRQTRTAYDGEKDDGGGVFQRGWAEGEGGREAQGQTIRKLYHSMRRGDGEGELKCGERVHSEASGECRVAMGSNGAM